MFEDHRLVDKVLHQSDTFEAWISRLVTAVVLPCLQKILHQSKVVIKFLQDHESSDSVFKLQEKFYENINNVTIATAPN